MYVYQVIAKSVYPPYGETVRKTFLVEEDAKEFAKARQSTWIDYFVRPEYVEGPKNAD